MSIYLNRVDSLEFTLTNDEENAAIDVFMGILEKLVGEAKKPGFVKLLDAEERKFLEALYYNCGQLL